MPRYALAQINCTVGDLEGNAAKILQALRDAAPVAPDLILFPELTLAGYPPEDLLLKPGFFEACRATLDELVPQIETPCLVGFPEMAENGTRYNACAYIVDGGIEAVYRKCILPNYAVFDEKRYFTPGESGLLLDIAGQKVGVTICEDVWAENSPAHDEALAGAQVIACLSASPFETNKDAKRKEVLRAICEPHDVWMLYCNLVGGQDELVFDGGSLILDGQGQEQARAREFGEDLLVFDVPDLPKRVVGDVARHGCGRCCENAGGCDGGCKQPAPAMPTVNRPALPERAEAKLSPSAEMYGALVLGVGDYVRKNGFSGVIIGLSGGIDSALTAAIAVDALGAEHVVGVTMPSQYSSNETRSDAEILAQNLGIRFETLPIAKPYAGFMDELAPLFDTVDSDPENLTDQNLQARIRAVYLMALSNKLGLLVLNTSNKSESAVGYGTLYGDMVGGYAAIRDVFKTDVWELSRYVNEHHGREVIPVSTIERVPSAELRPDQEDRHSIPDYPVLDPILELYVEQDLTLPEILAQGHDAAVVAQIARLVDRAEFKRRQAVMGPRVSAKAFGKDRRVPVTNRF